MAEEKSCPLASWMPGQSEINCAREGCAWWDSGSECCGVRTLAVFAVATMGYVRGAVASMQGVKKAKKGKEVGGNGE